MAEVCCQGLVEFAVFGWRLMGQTEDQLQGLGCS